MKRVCLTLVALALGASPVLAGFKVPGNVDRVEDLEKVQKKARSRLKSVTFVYADTASDSAVVASTTKKVIHRLKSKSLVVFVDVADDLAKLPKVVQEALENPKAGESFPKTVVFDPELKEVLMFIPFMKGKTYWKAIRDARKRLKALERERRLEAKIRRQMEAERR